MATLVFIVEGPTERDFVTNLSSARFYPVGNHQVSIHHHGESEYGRKERSGSFLVTNVLDYYRVPHAGCHRQ